MECDHKRARSALCLPGLLRHKKHVRLKVSIQLGAIRAMDETTFVPIQIGLFLGTEALKLANESFNSGFVNIMNQMTMGVDECLLQALAVP